MALAEDGELLRMADLLKEEPLAEVDTWWRNLPPIYRARGRWVFAEPAELDQPRQRGARLHARLPRSGALAQPRAAV